MIISEEKLKELEDCISFINKQLSGFSTSYGKANYQ